MYAGAFVPKSQMKQQTWIQTYENWNVDVGLRAGLQGRAQIGKGMWAMPDEMAAMLVQNQPSQSRREHRLGSFPTAATLHVTHYHQVNVFEVQNELKNANTPTSMAF